MIDRQAYQTEIARLCVLFDYSISKEKADEYYNKFRGSFSPDSFARTVDHLIDTFTVTSYKKFPTLHDFYNAKQFSYKSEYKPPAESGFISAKITAAWAHCFRLVWLITDKANREYYFTHLTDHDLQESSETELKILEYYRCRYIEIRTILERAGVDPKAIALLSKSTAIIPNIKTGKEISEICGF